MRGGGYRTSVQLLRGPNVDVMTMAPERSGTYLVHFTGSAAHNVRLRERARDMGWSLSEHGFEANHQGGCLVWVWPLRLEPGASMTVGMLMRVTTSVDRAEDEGL